MFYSCPKCYLKSDTFQTHGNVLSLVLTCNYINYRTFSLKGSFKFGLSNDLIILSIYAKCVYCIMPLNCETLLDYTRPVSI